MFDKIDINQMKIFGVVLVVLLCVDLPMILIINNKIYSDLLSDINKGDSVPIFNKIIYGLCAYLLVAFGIYYFCLNQSYLHVVLFAAVVFGVYDFTNLSIIANYNFKAASIDIGWGILCTLIVTIITSIISPMVISSAHPEIVTTTEVH